MNRKVKHFKQCFYRNTVRCQKLQQLFEVLSFALDTGAQSFRRSFIALSIISYLDRSQLRNSLFGCVKSLQLLWKPRSWF